MYPTDLKYTRDHEWVRVADGAAAVGITDFAQRQLGEVVFVGLPDVGRLVERGEVFGLLESVKTTSELLAPISGEVIAINDDLAAHPESVNHRPHESWMIRIKPAVMSEVDALLDASAYWTLIS